MNFMGILRKVMGAAGKSYDPEARALETYRTLRGLGYTHAQSSAWVGNEKAETSFDPDAIGDHDQAFDPAQHHMDRIDHIREHTGIEMRTASHVDQWRAIDWECQYGIGYRHVKEHIQAQGDDVGKIIEVIVGEFEHSSNQPRDIRRRTKYAREFLDVFDGIKDNEFPFVPALPKTLPSGQV